MRDERPQRLDHGPLVTWLTPRSSARSRSQIDVDGVVAGLVHHVGEGLRLPAQQVGPPEVAEAQVRPAGRRSCRPAPDLALGVGRGLLVSARRSLRGPGPPAWIHCGQLDEQPGARPLGRVRVEGDVEALGARIVDEGEQLRPDRPGASGGDRSG